METRIEVVKPTLLVSFFSLLNYSVAFITQVIIANYYGNNLERDAYLIALTFPSYITSIFVTSLPSVYLPVLIDLQNKSPEKFWQLARDVFIFFFAGLMLVISPCIAFARPILTLVAPGISEATFRMAQLLFIILLPSIIFNVLSGLFGSLYYARYRFLVPSLSTVLNSFTALIGVLVFNRIIGIYSLAMGALLGSLAGFLFLLPIIKDFPRGFIIGESGFYLRGFLSKAAPLILAGVIFQTTTVVQRRYASELPTGSISSLGYSTQITTVLSNVLSGGVATILFPLLSNAWARRDVPVLKKYFSIGVIVILALTIPFVVFFYYLGLPFIQIVFERGSFGYHDSMVVSNTLSILSGMLVFTGLGNIVAKGFYFSGRTNWAAIQEVLVLAVYLYLGYRLSEIWSVNGLALATTMTTGLSVLCSFVFMNYLLKGIDVGRIITALIQIVVAAIISGTISFGLYTIRIYIGELPAFAIAVLSQIAVYYLILMFVYKVPELLFVKEKVESYLTKLNIPGRYTQN